MIVVACPDRAERILQAGSMRCPRCRGRLRPFGHGRTRTVRGRGADTLRVTPRRARCGDCGLSVPENMHTARDLLLRRLHQEPGMIRRWRYN